MFVFVSVYMWKGSGIGPAVNDSVNTHDPPAVSMFSNDFFHTLSDNCRNQIPVLRLSVITRVDCTEKAKN